MNKRTIWLTGFVAVTATVTLYLGNREPGSEVESTLSATSTTTGEAGSAAAPASVDTPTTVAPSNTNQEPMAQAESPPDTGEIFQVDSAGRLALDERTRLKIEELVALTPSDKLYATTLEKTQALPPAAARQATELVERFVTYQHAQRTQFPPGRAPLTEEDALAELDGLHALREHHFGSDTAKAFYREEEALARELLELMKLEKDQSLTLAEKAERAQTIRSSLPKVAAAERENRKATAGSEEN